MSLRYFWQGLFKNMSQLTIEIRLELTRTRTLKRGEVFFNISKYRFIRIYFDQKMLIRRRNILVGKNFYWLSLIEFTHISRNISHLASARFRMPSEYFRSQFLQPVAHFVRTNKSRGKPRARRIAHIRGNVIYMTNGKMKIPSCPFHERTSLSSTLSREFNPRRARPSPFNVNPTFFARIVRRRHSIISPSRAISALRRIARRTESIVSAFSGRG